MIVSIRSHLEYASNETIQYKLKHLCASKLEISMHVHFSYDNNFGIKKIVLASAYYESNFDFNPSIVRTNEHSKSIEV